MHRHLSPSRGVLIAMRRGCRTWLARALVVGLAGMSPVTVAEATITTFGNVSPSPLGPGDSVVNSFVTVGASGLGALTVNGGNVLSQIPPGAGFNVGGDANAATVGQGAVVIDGAGSRIAVGPQGGFTVGRFGAGSTGALIITNGGRLSTTGFTVGSGNGAGANGSTGAVVVDGAQAGIPSSIAISGANSTGGAGGGLIGADLGQGFVALSNGARMDLTAAGATSGGPGFTLGIRGGRGPSASEAAPS